MHYEKGGSRQQFLACEQLWVSDHVLKAMSTDFDGLGLHSQMSMGTKALTLIGKGPTMGSKSATASPILLDRRRLIDHAFSEFAQGVGNMAEGGNTADIGSLVESLTAALRKAEQTHARQTVPPRLPGWVISTFVGLVVAIVMAIGAGLIGYGALQNRVLNLENAHPESLGALAAEVHSLGQRIEQMERRIDASLDQRQTAR